MTLAICLLLLNSLTSYAAPSQQHLFTRLIIIILASYFPLQFFFSNNIFQALACDIFYRTSYCTVSIFEYKRIHISLDQFIPNFVIYADLGIGTIIMNYQIFNFILKMC